MRVIGLLSWFEESPSWLAALIASGKGFVDHWVAVDGAYFLYPDALRHPSSGPEQAESIIQTAAACGISCSVHVPAEPWMDNEVGKRSFLFQAGELVAEPNVDWYFVADGDDLLNRVPFDARSGSSTRTWTSLRLACGGGRTGRKRRRRRGRRPSSLLAARRTSGRSTIAPCSGRYQGCDAAMRTWCTSSPTAAGSEARWTVTTHRSRKRWT
jgi:hypothetical protein